MNNKIRELQEQIKKEERKINLCNHDFDEPFYNPEIVMVGYGSKYVKMGSDSYHDYEGYTEKEKPRWTRICKNCGYEQHTYKQKSIIQEYEPDFT